MPIVLGEDHHFCLTKLSCLDSSFGFSISLRIVWTARGVLKFVFF